MVTTPHQYNTLTGEIIGAGDPVERGPGDFVKAQYDSALRSTGSRLWQGILKISGSGFGKGVMLAAALTIAVVAISVIAPAAAPETELMNGIFKGIGLLATTGTGLAIMAFGGAIGAGVDMVMRRNALSAAQAEALSKQYELERQQEQAKRLQKPAPESEYPTKSYVADEMQRRAKNNDGRQQPEGYGR